MRLIVFAYSQLGYDCLRLLITQGETIVAVFTHQNSLQEHIWFESVEKLAKDNQIPVFMPLSPNTPAIIETIRSLKPNIIFSFYYRQMICQEILDIPDLGAFNIHGSLLPQYRGRCPINWAIIQGESKTGVTLHHMVKAPDAGDIVDQEAVEIKSTDTAGILMAKINKAAQKLLKRQLIPLKEGTAPRLVQDHSKSSYFGGRTPKDSQIDWRQSAFQIHNLIRAMQPYPHYPPAFTSLKGEEIWMMKSRAPTLKTAALAIPGQITSLDRSGVEVACSITGTQRIKIEKIHCKNNPESDSFVKLKVGQTFQSSF